MKIMNLALAFVASLCIFPSCSNEVDEVVDKDVKVKKVFGVGTQAPQTRTKINNWESNAGESVSVHWQDTDDLTVFAEGHTKGDTFNFLNFNDGESHNIASFNGYTYENGPYYVLHPAQSGALLNGDKVKLNIPSNQNAVKNSFDSKANILLGKATTLESKTDLLNVCAYFRITVPADCHRVTVETTNTNWYLAGTVTVDNISSAGNHISAFDDCTNEIQLSGIPGEGTYFIAFMPSTGMDSDLTVTVYREAGTISKTFEKKTGGFNFVAGNYYNLGDAW